jgi:glutaredoxin-like protein
MDPVWVKGKIVANLLNESIRTQVRDIFDKQLKDPVGIILFESQEDCDTCEDTQQLLKEVSDLSDKISLEVYDLKEKASIASQYHMDKSPGIVFIGKDGDQTIDYGVRMAGIPSGHEFNTLIHDLILVSSRDSGLEQKTRDELKKLTQPVHLQVFVTPTCPYCPRAVVLAHMMAMESPLIEAEMVEAMEFPDLADRFNVSGVPQTTINQGAGTVVGAAPEDHLLNEIKRALG